MHNPREEIGSSSSLPTDIGSSSSLQTEIRSSSSLPTDIGSSSSLQTEIRSFSSLSTRFDSTSSPSTEFALPKVGKTIIDPISGDTCRLNKVIGSFYNGRCSVYRALCSKYLEEDNILVPSGYVTLKIINMNLHENESNELQRQGNTGITYTPHANIIGLNRTFTALNLSCVSLPYMSEGSLRYILSTRPDKKLPEDFISVILKVALVGLRDELHVESNLRVHKTLNAGDIFVHIDNVTDEMLIKLAFEASVYDSQNISTGEASSSSSFLDVKSISEWGAAPEVFGSNENEDNRGPKSDIWLLGITVLELAYGNLPVRDRGDLNYIIKKIREKKRFPKSLEKMLIKRNGKFKKVMDFVKRNKRVFSKEFEEMVLACLCENPKNRPTAGELLNTPFFTTAIEECKHFMLNRNN